MPEADVNGVTLAYEVDGPADGEPMLLVTGLGGQLTEWPPEMVGMLTDAGFRVIRPDNRDMGLSSRVDAPPPRPADVVKALAHRRLARSDYLLSDMAEDLAALLDRVGVGAAHVVGVSMGGMIAQQLTIDHPDRVLSLASIMSTTGDRRVGRISARLVTVFSASLRQPPPADREAAVRAGVEGWRAISGVHFDEAEMRAVVEAALDRGRDATGRVRQLMAIQASPDRTRALRSVRVPTLVIHGLMDPLVLPSGGIATARAVPGSRLLMFPDMGHDLPRPRRREITDALVTNAARAHACQ
ncbi:MAG TPA: alpha/beta hydrolase [Dermatophilaceae bacterium]|nr:alpha/beta hydrolase [Dermatophilaceae bacterium]